MLRLLLVFVLGVASGAWVHVHHRARPAPEPAPEGTWRTRVDQDGTWRLRFPAPTLGPEDVVVAQLDALASADPEGPSLAAPMEVVFRFASPSNRASTGPLSHFIEIVRSPTYAPLLAHAAARVEPARVCRDRHAQVDTEIRTDAGERVGYRFFLTRQADGEFSGCWMTDGVVSFRPAAEEGWLGLRPHGAPRNEHPRREDP